MAIKVENSIGFRIMQAFGAKNLKEVAILLDENYSSLHNWTTQKRDFPTNVLIKIAKLTNQTIDWILTGENGVAATANQSFEKMLEEQIRRVVREEIENSAAIHEKIQGIILAMQSNIKEKDVFEKTAEEEKAA